MDCSQSSSSVHRILQGKILEWAAMPSSRGSSRLKNQTCVSCVSYTVGEFFTTEPPGKPLIMCIFELYYCIDFMFYELCSQCEPFCKEMGVGCLKRRCLDKTKSMFTHLCMLALKITELFPCSWLHERVLLCYNIVIFLNQLAQNVFFYLAVKWALFIYIPEGQYYASIYHAHILKWKYVQNI